MLAPCLAVAATARAGAAPRTNTPRADVLAAEVARIIGARCVGCHGPEEASGGLRLDSYEMLMRGGDRGPVVMPSNARASLLLRKVTRGDKPFMPPRRPLASADIRRIRRWIELGAPRWQ